MRRTPLESWASENESECALSPPRQYDALIPVHEDVRLAAEVWRSTRPTSARRAVVFVHGFCGNRDENGLFHRLAAECCARGLHAVLYDWRGIGSSQGEFSRTSLEDHVADFKVVVDWTREHFRDEVPAMCGVGFSLGAAVIGSALAETMKLSSVAYLSPAVRPRRDMWPRYNTPDIKRELAEHGVVKKPGSSVLLGEPILESLRETDLGPRAFDLDAPLLVCHGTADTRIAFSSSKKLAAERDKLRASGRKSFLYEEFRGASHSFRPEAESWDRLASLVTDWFGKAGSSKASGTSSASS
jgi:alpha-beta hydrolase superfamily lysophospholipase